MRAVRTLANCAGLKKEKESTDRGSGKTKSGGWSERRETERKNGDAIGSGRGCMFVGRAKNQLFRIERARLESFTHDFFPIVASPAPPPPIRYANTWRVLSSRV